MPIIRALASEENERENENAALFSPCFKPKLRNPCCNDIMWLQRCMGFQRDPEKDAANLAKHLLGFRQAVEIFRAFRLTRDDDRRDYGERRLAALGVYAGDVLRVVHTTRERDIRIISAWKASRRDRQTFAAARTARQV